jgi:hypothetical protein
VQEAIEIESGGSHDPGRVTESRIYSSAPAYRNELEIHRSSW